jgi:hypothetical protein
MKRHGTKVAPHVLRRTVSKLVANAYPGCTPEFVGSESHAGPRTGGEGN